MTQATHTPGPWITEGLGQSYGLYDPDGCMIGSILKNRQNSGETARLIAAAPDLLAALEQCLPIIDAHRRAALGEGDIAAMNARAAIAKAKGE